MEQPTGHDAAHENTRATQQEVTPAGTHLALAHSLKCAGEAQAEDHAGWAVLSRRAEGFVRAAGMGVTRLLFQPDLRLRDPAVDEDLQVLACSIGDDFSVRVTTMGRESHKARAHLLADMHVAGPINDGVRAMVAGMMQTLVEDSVGKAIEGGELGGVAIFDKLHKLQTVLAMTPEALVDQHWTQLEASATEDVAYITRDELAAAMLEAAVQAVGGGVVDQRADMMGDETLPGVEVAHIRDPANPDHVDVVPVHGEQLAEEPQEETVHHLQAHPSYVMDAKGSCRPEGEYGWKPREGGE